MTIYEVPENTAELFTNGETSYRICDPEQSGDNIEAMNLFINVVDIPSEMIEENYGTQITICDGSKRLVIDSGGLGDFHLHGYEVSLAEVQP